MGTSITDSRPPKGGRDSLSAAKQLLQKPLSRNSFGGAPKSKAADSDSSQEGSPMSATHSKRERDKQTEQARAKALTLISEIELQRAQKMASPRRSGNSVSGRSSMTWTHGPDSMEGETKSQEDADKLLMSSIKRLLCSNLAASSEPDAAQRQVEAEKNSGKGPAQEKLASESDVKELREQIKQLQQQHNREMREAHKIVREVAQQAQASSPQPDSRGATRGSGMPPKTKKSPATHARVPSAAAAGSSFSPVKSPLEGRERARDEELERAVPMAILAAPSETRTAHFIQQQWIGHETGVACGNIQRRGSNEQHEGALDHRRSPQAARLLALPTLPEEPPGGAGGRLYLQTQPASMSPPGYKESWEGGEGRTASSPVGKVESGRSSVNSIDPLLQDDWEERARSAPASPALGAGDCHLPRPSLDAASPPPAALANPPPASLGGIVSTQVAEKEENKVIQRLRHDLEALRVLLFVSVCLQVILAHGNMHAMITIGGEYQA